MDLPSISLAGMQAPVAGEFERGDNADDFATAACVKASVKELLSLFFFPDVPALENMHVGFRWLIQAVM